LPRSLGLLNESMQLRAVDELDVSAAGEAGGVIGESAGGDDIPTRRTPGGHDSIQLTHDIDADPEGLPLLALNKELLAATGKDKINSPIGTTTARLSHRVTLQPERLSDELLELRPRHPVQRVGALALHGVLHKGPALTAPPG